MQIGIDLGGTKIEVIALSDAGEELFRKRVPTPQGSYTKTLDAIVDLVADAETATSLKGTVGIGIPGTLSPKTGVVKNANSTWLNGQPIDKDLFAKLHRQVAIANDANCMALSEAVDGSGQGYQSVFAIIIGTGCGAGIAINGQVHSGGNGIGGEWGHNPLPWLEQVDEEHMYAMPCYCGQKGCIETFVSGTGLCRTYGLISGQQRQGREIVALAEQGDEAASSALDLFEKRLGKAIASIVNVLDPDVIVLAGGASNIDRIYHALPSAIEAYTFGGEFDTPVVKATHGDSSGVRGAAWLGAGLKRM
ncbi:fructokinase [Vibrio diabolicus]|uniref:fructokinase n=1 Tax=Vibrio diabolicus TaxID=50719 RepID=UPI00294064AB|nr:fructokinase [Vibrio diabolicus]MDV5037645.1 fructokinase [Vibrio diabolicus]